MWNNFTINKGVKHECFMKIKFSLNWGLNITEGLSGTKGRFGTIISCKESVQTTVYKKVEKAKCHTSDIHAFYIKFVESSSFMF